MDYTFPDKYHHVARYFDHYVGGDLEKTTKLDNERKLMFYALRMQADHGKCDTPSPSLWHVTERYKHQAWSKLGSMSNFEAMVYFVKCFEDVLKDRDGGAPVNWIEKMKELTSAGAASSGAVAASGVETRTGASVPQAEWDDDIRARSAPTAENIAYLASELMLARRQLLGAAPAAARPVTTSPVEPLLTGGASAEGGSPAPSPETRSVASSSPPAAATESHEPRAAHKSRRVYAIRGPAIVRGKAFTAPLTPPVRADMLQISSSASEASLVSAARTPPMKPMAAHDINASNPPPYLMARVGDVTAALEADSASSREGLVAQSPGPAPAPATTSGWMGWLW